MKESKGLLRSNDAEEESEEISLESDSNNNNNNGKSSKVCYKSENYDW